jgi:hypothetical protein
MGARELSCKWFPYLLLDMNGAQIALTGTYNPQRTGNIPAAVGEGLIQLRPAKAYRPFRNTTIQKLNSNQ